MSRPKLKQIWHRPFTKMASTVKNGIDRLRKENQRYSAGFPATRLTNWLACDLKPGSSNKVKVISVCIQAKGSIRPELTKISAD